MGILLTFEAVVSDNLSREDTAKLVDNVRATKGVLSATFHRCCGNCSSCTRESGIRVTYDGSEATKNAIQALPGVVKLKPLL